MVPASSLFQARQGTASARLSEARQLLLLRASAALAAWKPVSGTLPGAIVISKSSSLTRVPFAAPGTEASPRVLETQQPVPPWRFPPLFHPGGKHGVLDASILVLIPCDA